jgi:hypothetical protein
MLDIVCLMGSATRPATLIARIMQKISRPLPHIQTLSRATGVRTSSAEQRARSTTHALSPSPISSQQMTGGGAALPPTGAHFHDDRQPTDAGPFANAHLAEIDTRTSFGRELAPTPENIRTQFRRLRETSSQLGEAAAMWQSSASQFATALQAARKANACAPAIESLKHSLSECEATAARLSIKHDVAEAVLAVKQLGSPSWPYSQIIGEAIHHLDAAIKRHRSYAAAATLHPPAIEGFNMGLREIASVAQLLRQRLTAAHPCAPAAGSLHDLALALRTALAGGIAGHCLGVPAPQRAPIVNMMLSPAHVAAPEECVT